MENSARKTVVCVLSSNFSGSHFLSLMLGSHSQAAHVGELKNIWKNEDRVCHVCRGIDECVLYKDLYNQPSDQLHNILFQRLPEDIHLLIDASKKPKWFKRFINQKNYDLRFIHLIRDPRALLRRWLLTYDSDKLRNRQWIRMARKAPFQVLSGAGDFDNLLLNKWLSGNKEITRFLQNNHLNYRTTTYDAIARDPEIEIANIMQWLGVDYEPSQLTYWNFDHHGTQKRDYEWVKEKQETNYFDVRWKEFLSSSQVQKAENHKAILSYLKQNRLCFSDTGLTAL